MHGCRSRRAVQKRAALAKPGVFPMDGKAYRTRLKRGIGETRENLSFLFFLVPAELPSLNRSLNFSSLKEYNLWHERV